MEAIALEDGNFNGGDPPLPAAINNIKREIEPDSSEQDAESPDEGGSYDHNIAIESSMSIAVKDEPLELEGESLSYCKCDVTSLNHSSAQVKKELHIEICSCISQFSETVEVLL